MAISEAARRNHDELFPNRTSTLAQTDPELIEYFDNFAFGEVVADSQALDPSLDVRLRTMVQLAAIIASNGVAEFRAMAGAALTVGVTPVQLKEIVYQAVAYVGMARVFDFVHAVNEVLAEAGVDLPLPGQSTTTPEDRLEKGTAVQGEIIGEDAVKNRYAKAPDDEQHLERYLSANCFGDHLTRGGIEVPVRELLTFALLAALGGADAQVKGHVVANLRVGNDRARLLGVLTALVPFIGYPRTLNALAALDSVTGS
jgi:4-carboxymuconolactone decarboxylase